MYIRAKTYLEEIRSTRRAIDNKVKELKEYDFMLEASGITYDNLNVTVSPRQDGLEKKAIAHIERCAELRADIAEMIEWMHKRIDEAVNYINQIESKEQQEVLILRYINCYNWAEIADIRDRSEESQQRLAGRGRKSLQAILDREGEGVSESESSEK